MDLPKIDFPQRKYKDMRFQLDEISISLCFTFYFIEEGHNCKFIPTSFFIFLLFHHSNQIHMRGVILERKEKGGEK